MFILSPGSVSDFSHMLFFFFFFSRLVESCLCYDSHISARLSTRVMFSHALAAALSGGFTPLVARSPAFVFCAVFLDLSVLLCLCVTFSG